MKNHRLVYFLGGIAILVMVGIFSMQKNFSATAPSSLSQLAGSMQAGTWAELTTANLSTVFSDSVSGGVGHILPYAEGMRWDPVTKKVYYIGSDDPGDGRRFVSYSEDTNSWTALPDPWTGSGVAHEYDGTDIDLMNRVLHTVMPNGNVGYSYNLDSGIFANMPAFPGLPYSCCEASVYFPEMQGLILLNWGNLYKLGDLTKQWSTVATGFSTTYHSFAEYNPIHKVVVFGGGNDSTRNFYKLDSSGQVTVLNAPPINLQVPRIEFTYDPVSGLYLVYTMQGTFYTYNVLTDTWALQSSAGIPIFVGSGSDILSAVAAPVSLYGVVMWVACESGGSGSCRTYLYKHSSSETSSDTVVPTTPTNLTATALSSSQINLSWTASTDNVGVAGYRIFRNNVEIATTAGTTFSNTGLTASTNYTYAVSAYDAASNGSPATTGVSATTLAIVPPVTGGGPLIPTVQDEKNTYNLWGWTYTAGQVTNQTTSPFGTVSDPGTHNDTEGDDLWTSLMMYKRGGGQGYLDRAQAWVTYYKTRYLQCLPSGVDNWCYDRDNFGMDHAYGWGMVSWYEYTCATSTCDTNALTVAENIAAEIETYWNNKPNAIPGTLSMNYWGMRQPARHLLLATRLAEVTANPRWIGLRDRLINLWVASPDWSSAYGMYFESAEQTDYGLGAGAYAAGIRINSAFQIGVLAEAFYETYRTTGRQDVKAKLIAMANYVNTYGLDPTYQYTGSRFGQKNGVVWHNYSSGGSATFWDPVYTTSLVNTLVIGYKLTGTTALLTQAKTFLNRGTKGIYGDPIGRAAGDTQVHHFIDSTFDSSSGDFYFRYNKGELQYTYLLFENEGSPTVIDTTPPPTPSLRGDFNSDGRVNLSDLNILKSVFKFTGSRTEDLSSDSIIDVRDVGILMSGWVP